MKLEFHFDALAAVVERCLHFHEHPAGFLFEAHDQLLALPLVILDFHADTHAIALFAAPAFTAFVLAAFFGLAAAKA